MKALFNQHKILIIGGAAAFALSTLASAMKPVMLTTLMQEAGFDELAAGFAVGAPFLGMGLASVLINPLLKLFSSRNLIIVFAAISFLAHFISANLFHESLVLFIAQVFSGLSVGIFLGLCSIVISRQDKADLLFGMVDTLAVLSMSFFFSSSSYVAKTIGIAGGYYYALLITAVLLPLVWLLIKQFKLSNEKKHHEKARPLGNKLGGCGVLMLGVLLITATGLGFAFSFNIATDLGMDFVKVGHILGYATLFSALGPITGGLCANRWGRQIPLFIGITMATACWSVVILAPNPLIFSIAIFPAIFFLNSCIPILLGIASALDDFGSWAAIASPLYIAGFAIAPVLGGFIIKNLGLNTLAAATIIGGAMCVLLQYLLRPTGAKA